MVVVVTFAAFSAASPASTTTVTGEKAHRALLQDPAGDVRYVAPDADYDWGEVVERPAADVVAARIRYGHLRLFVRMRFVNLRRLGSQQYEAMVATPATGDQNYYFHINSNDKHRSGVQQAYHYVDGRFDCTGMRHTIHFSKDVVRMSIPASCLGEPWWVRVELNNSLTTTASAADWLQWRDNPFNRLPWADTTTGRLYRTRA